MYSKREEKPKNTAFNLRMFDAQKESYIEELNSIIDAEIARKEEEIESLELTHEKMIEWLKGYVNSSDFLTLYADKRSLVLTAEATFWSVKLGLDSHLEKMSYKEIRTFRPLMESIMERTSRAYAIQDVRSKLVKPAMSHEASYALGQAAWCIYVHNKSYEKMQEEEIEYNSGSQAPSSLMSSSNKAKESPDIYTDQIVNSLLETIESSARVQVAANSLSNTKPSHEFPEPKNSVYLFSQHYDDLSSEELLSNGTCSLLNLASESTELAHSLETYKKSIFLSNTGETSPASRLSLVPPMSLNPRTIKFTEHLNVIHGAWDTILKTDTKTGENLFVYSLYNGEAKVGSATFFKHQLFCRSTDKSRHNVIETTGILAGMKDKINIDLIEDVCQSLPMTFMQTVQNAAMNGAQVGLLRGIANCYGNKLKLGGYSDSSVGFYSQACFYGLYGSMKFGEYYLRMQAESEITQISSGILLAAYETGNMILISAAIYIVNLLLLQASQYFAQNEWNNAASTFRAAGKLIQWGLFATNLGKQGIAETATSMIAGQLTRIGTEQLLPIVEEDRQENEDFSDIYEDQALLTRPN